MKKLKDDIFLLVLQRIYNGFCDMSEICVGYFQRGTVLVLCCIRNYHTLDDLKQYIFSISQLHCVMHE